MWYHYLVIKIKHMKKEAKPTINDILKRHNVGNIPDPKIIYYAYSKGRVQEFCTYRDASQYTQNVERVVVNRHEINAARIKWKDQIKSAKIEWYRELKLRYLEIDEKIFDLCYYDIADEDEYGLVNEDKLERAINFAMSVVKHYTNKE